LGRWQVSLHRLGCNGEGDRSAPARAGPRTKSPRWRGKHPVRRVA
jgi:hypothetical protein